MPMLPKVPPASSSPMFVPSLREGEYGVAKTERTLPKRLAWFAGDSLVCRTISPRLVCGPPQWKNSAAKSPEEICRRPGRFPKFRAHAWSLQTSGRFAGEMAKATLPTRRMDQLVCHDRRLLRLTSEHCGKITHGDPVKIARRADFSSAPVYVLVSGHGDSAKATTRLNWFANVASRLLARVSPRGRTQCRCCRDAPSAQCPL